MIIISKTGGTMKNLFNLLFVFSITVLFISCNSDDEPTAPTAGGQEPIVYTNNDLKFKISAPYDWEFLENVTVEGYEVLLLGKKNNFEGVQPAFNIVVQEVATTMSPELLITTSENNLPIMFDTVVFESKNVKNIGGYDCAVVEFRLKKENKNLKMRQLLFMCQPKKLMVISFDSTVDQFDRDKYYFDSIQNTIEKL